MERQKFLRCLAEVSGCCLVSLSCEASPFLVFCLKRAGSGGVCLSAPRGVSRWTPSSLSCMCEAEKAQGTHHCPFPSSRGSELVCLLLSAFPRLVLSVFCVLPRRFPVLTGRTGKSASSSSWREEGRLMPLVVLCRHHLFSSS